MLPPLDVVIIGNGLNTYGFSGNNTIAGLGLNTLGFLWPCDGIWTPTDDASLTTTWVAASVPSTIETCVDDNGGLYG